MSEPALPNFFVVGAMKAGTTSLFQYMGQHPDVFVPSVKEPHFFSSRSSTDFKGPDPRGHRMTREAYLALFAEARHEKARGEATPVYLCDPEGLERIRDEIPQARLIVALRQPVDRAYSAWLMKRRQGWERLGFLEALAEEPRRISEGWRPAWHYARLGRYREQIEQCRRCFPSSQIKVVLFDDLVRDPRTVVSELFRFLGVDDAFEVDFSVPTNAAFLTRVPAIHRWRVRPSPLRDRVKRLAPRGAHSLWRFFTEADRRLNVARAPALATAVRARLTREWDDEIVRLQDCIGRDLSSWRER